MAIFFFSYLFPFLPESCLWFSLLFKTIIPNSLFIQKAFPSNGFVDTMDGVDAVMKKHLSVEVILFVWFVGAILFAAWHFYFVNCDRSIVLDKGKIIESGTYNKLMGMNGVFAELARRQLV